VNDSNKSKFDSGEIKRRLNSINACYYSVHKLLSSRQLSKNIKIRIYKATTLPVVLYGCEAWSLILGEEHGLRVFKNRVLRRTSGQKRDEMMGGWRKLRNEELHNLYSSPSIIRMIKSRRMRWARGEEECIWNIGGKARRKETTRKSKAYVGD
jgi:hypothetical protein